MLHALLEYARQERLTAEPGLKPKTVRWLLLFSPEGRFLGLQDLRSDDGSSKGREFPACPDLTQQELVAAACRHFLVDGLDVVCLLTKDGQVDEKLVAKHESFVDLLQRAADAVPVLACIGAALRDATQLEAIRADLAEHKAKPTELATFAVVENEGPSILVERRDWHAWWQVCRREMADARKAKSPPASRRKKGESDAGPPRMRCLLSGELIEPLPTHNKIEGLSDVGGLAMGDALTSFDKDAFGSFGLEQGANAAMGEAMVKTYVTALNHLIRYRSHRMAGVKVVYWYSGPVDRNDDPMRELWEGFGLPAPEETDEADDAPQDKPGEARERAQAESCARRLLQAIQSGERSDLAAFRYYALTLSANSGRVVVRDWTEGQFEELLRSINAWFDDLAIPLLDSTNMAKPPRFEQVLTSCLDERPQGQAYGDWVKPVSPHRPGLWRAALGGPRQPIPRAVVEQAVIAHCATLLARHSIATPSFGSNRITKTGSTDKVYRLSLLLTRMGLIRAYCNRFARTTGSGDYHVQTVLDTNHPRSAYHVGRLMAVLEMIQQKAQGELGATIAQTHYAAAATRPITALPRLQTLVQHHIPKIEPYRLRQEYLRLLTEINLAIGGSIARTFDLEDQCLFHLGYYHQRAFTPYDESPKRHWTLNGDNVRSKSEVIVANLLAQLGIEYEYEAALHLRSTGNARGLKRVDRDFVEIHPDFTIRKTKDGRPVYVEHLGMMDNFAYRSDWDDRRALFAQNDILSPEEGGGANGVLVVTQEEKGNIDCRRLVEVLKQLL